jgi:hypothetical protein
MGVGGLDVDRALGLPRQNMVIREVGGTVEQGLEMLGGEDIPTRRPVATQVLGALVRGEAEDLEGMAPFRGPRLVDQSWRGEEQEGAGSMETGLAQAAAELDDVPGQGAVPADTAATGSPTDER